MWHANLPTNLSPPCRDPYTALATAQVGILKLGLMLLRRVNAG